jgi:uncharacterized protein
MVRASCFALVLAMMVAAPASAQNRPSFDCAKATEDVETAICKSGKLAKLDRDIASAYAQARRQLDPSGQEALQEDQESFLSSRAAALAENSKSLMEFMGERLKLLRGMVAPPPGGGEAAFLGQWHNDSGFVRITRAAGGALKVSIETSTPVTGMRACSVEQTAALKDAKLTFRSGEVTVSVQRKSGLLEVEHEGDLHIVCGHGSWLRGTYFRVNWSGKRELPR